MGPKGRVRARIPRAYARASVAIEQAVGDVLNATAHWVEAEPVAVGVELAAGVAFAEHAQHPVFRLDWDRGGARPTRPGSLEQRGDLLVHHGSRGAAVVLVLERAVGAKEVGLGHAEYAPVDADPP